MSLQNATCGFPAVWFRSLLRLGLSVAAAPPECSRLSYSWLLLAWDCGLVASRRKLSARRWPLAPTFPESPPHTASPNCGCLAPLADESLASYLATTAPQVQSKCGQSACGDNATHHLKTFLHGCMRVTLSVTVLPSQELPGADRGQIWVWARPLNADLAAAAGVRRVALSPEASCLSFGAPPTSGLRVLVVSE